MIHIFKVKYYNNRTNVLEPSINLEEGSEQAQYGGSKIKGMEAYC